MEEQQFREKCKKLQIEVLNEFEKNPHACVVYHVHSLCSIMAMDAKIDSYMKAIQEEMKDFNGRLCAVEEKNKKK